LAGNGSYLNRGCEAIVRGTTCILKNSFEQSKLINANFDFSKTPYLPTETGVEIINKPVLIERWSSKWMLKQTLQRLSTKMDAWLMFQGIKDDMLASRAVLSVGGDNYSLDYGKPHNLIALDNYVRSLNRPLIIWGASIGPFDSDPSFEKQIIRHFKETVTAFFVREERSRQYLLQNGFSENVFYMGDPAFVMEPEKVPADKLGFFLPHNAIGINLSPLMAKWVTSGNSAEWMHQGIEIIRSIRRYFNMPVVLIPHVTISSQNDYLFLSKVASEISDKDIYLVPETLNAPQTKWVISQMACLVGARTHATIASMSSCVPTISLAYSIKAKGINEQVFGNLEYVLAAGDINSDSIVKLIKKALDKQIEIKSSLNKVIPDIKNTAIEAGITLKRLLS
jgi:polysaccharide pyruvyl transferase WcaK-like protein